MKKFLPFIIIMFALMGLSACSQSAYRHHMVRMVDAKSYLDHPMSASMVYYYK